MSTVSTSDEEEEGYENIELVSPSGPITLPLGDITKEILDVINGDNEEKIVNKTNGSVNFLALDRLLLRNETLFNHEKYKYLITVASLLTQFLIIKISSDLHAFSLEVVSPNHRFFTIFTKYMLGYINRPEIRVDRRRLKQSSAFIVTLLVGTLFGFSNTLRNKFEKGARNGNGQYAKMIMNLVYEDNGWGYNLFEEEKNLKQMIKYTCGKYSHFKGRERLAEIGSGIKYACWKLHDSYDVRTTNAMKKAAAFEICTEDWYLIILYNIL